MSLDNLLKSVILCPVKLIPLDTLVCIVIMSCKLLYLCSIMTNSGTHSRAWKVLCWNVSGLNFDTKWNSIRDKIVERGCDVICLQETKRFFCNNFIKKMCPPCYDVFYILN